jgi:hypothetical protein
MIVDSKAYSDDVLLQRQQILKYLRKMFFCLNLATADYKEPLEEAILLEYRCSRIQSTFRKCYSA